MQSQFLLNYKVKKKLQDVKKKLQDLKKKQNQSKTEYTSWHFALKKIKLTLSSMPIHLSFVYFINANS